MGGRRSVPSARVGFCPACSRPALPLVLSPVSRRPLPGSRTSQLGRHPPSVHVPRSITFRNSPLVRLVVFSPLHAEPSVPQPVDSERRPCLVPSDGLGGVGMRRGGPRSGQAPAVSGTVRGRKTHQRRQQSWTGRFCGGDGSGAAPGRTAWGATSPHSRRGTLCEVGEGRNQVSAERGAG